MSKLYTSLAPVYDEIYQKLFDYDLEFARYDAFLKKYKATSLLEIGCGAGRLASRLAAAPYGYTGMDLHREMLELAAQNAPGCHFIESDMRHFQLPKPCDAALITGRTISYLTSNQDVLDCFASVHKCLKSNGILVFDAIDAAPIFSTLQGEKQDELTVQCGEKNYRRQSSVRPNLQTGWTWDWASTYFLQQGDDFVEIGQDAATLRAFTHDEMTLFLNRSGFESLEIVKKETYAWQDYFYVARKKGNQ